MLKVEEVNEGPKIAYSVSKNKITFAEELTVSVDKMEKDYEVTKDICIDEDGDVCTGLGDLYAAQIIIPARTYTETMTPNPDYNKDDPMSQETIVTRTPNDFSMDNVTLRLFSLNK